MKSKKRHVVFFIPSLAVGGAEKVFVTLANGFIEKGWKVDFLTLDSELKLRDDLSAKISFSVLPAKRVMFCLPSLIKYLNNTSADIIISALQPSNFVISLAHLFSSTRSKLILTEHSNSSMQLLAMGPVNRIIVKFGIKWSYTRSCKVIAVSAGVKRCLNEKYNIRSSKISVVHNPANIPMVRKYGLKPVGEPWFNQTKIPIGVSVGRLIPAKNIDLLIDAVAVALSIKPFYLAIIGDGELRCNLERKVADLGLEQNIKFLGYKSNPFAYMARSNLLVVSSVREGFSNVIVESLALGIPVVSTNCNSGPVEILEDGKWGVLVPVGDVQSLAQEILKVLNDPPSFCNLRAYDFSHDRVVQNYIRVISGEN